MNEKLFKPLYLKHLCETYHLRPSKKYGQNFLISDSPIKKMIEVADLDTDDTVVEIGPGFGVLTFALSEQVKQVTAFEIERTLADYWKEELEKNKNIEIIWGDVSDQLPVISDQFSKGYKVVANLPYQITSRVLRMFFELENKPESITVMVQKEVAERIVAKPRSADSRQAGEMSVLAVSIQYYGEAKIVANVPKGNFWPEPKVDSALVHINTTIQQHQNTGVDDLFFKIVKAGFASKRKQLWRNLSVGLGVDRDKVKGILKDVAGNEKVRAQELGVGEWCDLVKRLGV
jgi:16S rRNA (adenine1518-N6/adenine1519-N6)-dimethyltransferase